MEVQSKNLTPAILDRRVKPISITTANNTVGMVMETKYNHSRAILTLFGCGRATGLRLVALIPALDLIASTFLLSSSIRRPSTSARIFSIRGRICPDTVLNNNFFLSKVRSRYIELPASAPSKLLTSWRSISSGVRCFSSIILRVSVVNLPMIGSMIKSIVCASISSIVGYNVILSGEYQASKMSRHPKAGHLLHLR